MSNGTIPTPRPSADAPCCDAHDRVDGSCFWIIDLLDDHTATAVRRDEDGTRVLLEQARQRLLTPNEAREQARLLLAAADHAEHAGGVAA